MERLKNLPQVTLADDEIRMLSWISEFIRLCAAINLPEASRMISYALLLSRAPVSELGLSQSLGLPRTTVRDKVRRMVMVKMIERIKNQGVKLTPLGRCFFILLYRELTEIAQKQRRTLSEELIMIMEELDELSPWDVRVELPPELLPGSATA